MESFTILLIIVAVAAVWVWIKKYQKNSFQQIAHSPEPELDQYHQAISDSAQRLVEIINESLKIANESKNADTKVSRLDVAKVRLEELKRLSDEHPFIKLTQLAQVEKSIAELEQEFLQAQYRDAAEGNMRGQELEKEGNIDAAILEYERLLEEGAIHRSHIAGWQFYIQREKKQMKSCGCCESPSKMYQLRIALTTNGSLNGWRKKHEFIWHRGKAVA